MDSMAESFGGPQAKKRKIITSPAAITGWPTGTWPDPLNVNDATQGVLMVVPGELIAIAEPDLAAAVNNNVVT